MSPRPRETSDEEILAATGRVMQRLGPTQITLADVAREAGVVPATIIQRFKTKRGLLLAACRDGAGCGAEAIRAKRGRNTLPRSRRWSRFTRTVRGFPRRRNLWRTGWLICRWI